MSIITTLSWLKSLVDNGESNWNFITSLEGINSLYMNVQGLTNKKNKNTQIQLNEKNIKTAKSTKIM